MHPELWTVPGINYPIRTWGFFVVVGVLVALWISVRRARRRGLDPSVITSMALIGVLLGVVGCRLMHVIHYFAPQLRSGQMSLKDAALMSGGGEILGGVLLAGIGVAVYLRIRRKPILAYLDLAAAPVILAMGIGRLGCFGFGCCWGGVCVTDTGDKALPWAVRFPYGSPAYMREWQDGRIKVPDELIWKSSVTKEPEPIPRHVLYGLDVDNRPLLDEFMVKGDRYASLRKSAPDSEEAHRLRRELAELSHKMGKHSPAELADDIAASLHLRRISEAAGRPVKWSDLRSLASTQHSLWLHPAQLYDAISLGVMFLLLSAIYARSRYPGMVVAWTMVLYPASRIVMEIVRTDNPHDTLFGLTISQFLSVVVLVVGLAAVVLLPRLTSPRAVAQERPNAPAAV